MSGPSYSFLLVLLLIIFGFLKLAASASALGSMSAPPVFAMSHDFFCALGISFSFLLQNPRSLFRVMVESFGDPSRFSAPNYCGEFDNSAAMLCVNEDLGCKFTVVHGDMHKST